MSMCIIISVKCKKHYFKEQGPRRTGVNQNAPGSRVIHHPHLRSRNIIQSACHHTHDTQKQGIDMLRHNEKKCYKAFAPCTEVQTKRK